MNQYFKNLWLALTGADPFREELDELRGKIDKAAEHVSSLKNLYYETFEKLSNAERWVINYQKLIEQLRSRIEEKDVRLKQQDKEFSECIARIEADHKRWIEEYYNKIDELKNKN